MAVSPSELLFDVAVPDDDEFPVLPIRTGRRPQRQLDALQHHRVVDRIGKDAPHRSLSHHRFEQRLRCYQVHIGLGDQAWNAYTQNWPQLAATAQRLLAVARGDGAV